MVIKIWGFKPQVCQLYLREFSSKFLLNLLTKRLHFEANFDSCRVNRTSVNSWTFATCSAWRKPSPLLNIIMRRNSFLGNAFRHLSLNINQADSIGDRHWKSLEIIIGKVAISLPCPPLLVRIGIAQRESILQFLSIEFHWSLQITLIGNWIF